MDNKRDYKSTDEDFEVDADISYDYVSDRGIFKNIMEFYDVQTKLVNGVPFSRGYVYPNEAIKVRVLPKQFSSRGPIGETYLFGKDKFAPGSRDTIAITEGEDDALSLYQMLNQDVAVVSVKNAITAYGDVLAEQEYLNSFDKIVLFLDNDFRGREATKSILRAGLFDYNKLYFVEGARFKDATEYLEKGQIRECIQDWTAAKRFTPDTIINTFDQIKEALERKKDAAICGYPFDSLSERLHGIHRSEFILLKGLEGRGKTEVCRAILYKVLKETDHSVATVFLEEDEAITVKGVATYELSLPCASEEIGISDEEIFEGYKKAVSGNDKRLYIHKHFATDNEEELIDSLRFLVSVAGVTLVLLDNLTMLTTGRAEEDERLKIDRIIRRLRDLVNELAFCLILVAHVNDVGQTRGSRLPDKLANTVIYMSRNILSPILTERNRADFMIEKARIQGTRTGPGGSAFFDPVSFKLLSMSEGSETLPPLVN